MTSSTPISGSLPSLPLPSLQQANSLNASIVATNSISNTMNALDIVTSSVATVFAPSTTSSGSINSKITVTPDEIKQWMELSKKIESFLSHFLDSNIDTKIASTTESDQKDNDSKVKESDWRSRQNQLLVRLRAKVKREELEDFPDDIQIRRITQERQVFLERQKEKLAKRKLKFQSLISK